MSMELFSNAGASTLNGSITSGATTLVVTAATSFPGTGNFRIIIDTEIMIVTAVSGTTFTVTRAAESTTAASHSSAAAVTHIITNGSLQQFRADTIENDVVASLPAAGIAGRMFLPDDGYWIYKDNGVIWKAYGPVYPLTPPDDSTFSWVNQGSSTISSSHGATTLYAPSNGASDSLRCRVKSAPATPYKITIGFNFIGELDGGATSTPAFLLRESATGKICLILLFGVNTNMEVRTFKCSNVNTFTALAVDNKFTMSKPYWMQLENDGTNIKFKLGCDPYNFLQIDSQTITSMFTTAPDQYGYALDPYGCPGIMTVFHLKEE